jgi:hypothetical protein
MKLNPRDALFGGRTNAAKLYHLCERNEKIRYYDFTSLYPFVQKNCKYPIGLPEIFTENFNDDITNYFGIIRCKVLPPNNLLFPVLPARINGKLVFTLCYKCALNRDTKCFHNNNDKLIDGTWVTEEVKVALKYGYKIQKIFCVWHWNKISDSNTNLFEEYVNTFLKQKQQNSGFP